MQLFSQHVPTMLRNVPLDGVFPVGYGDDVATDCNELKLGTETKADPSMSRQTLRETILTDSQLQGSEKHKQSAVV